MLPEHPKGDLLAQNASGRASLQVPSSKSSLQGRLQAGRARGGSAAVISITNIIIIISHNRQALAMPSGKTAPLTASKANAQLCARGCKEKDGHGSPLSLATSLREYPLHLQTQESIPWGCSRRPALLNHPRKELSQKQSEDIRGG